MQSPSTFPPSGTPFSLVVVSDVCEFAHRIVETVRGLGWQVQSARGADDALAQVLSGTSRLLVIDLDSSSFDGFDLLALVRSHERSGLASPLPAVACASEVSDLLQAKCVLEGFHLVIEKSSAAEEIRDDVMQMLLGRTQHAATALTADREGIERFLHSLAIDSSAGQWRSALTGIRLALQGEMLRLVHDAALSIAHWSEGQDERDRIAAAAAAMAQHSLPIGCVRMAALARRLARDAGDKVEGRILMLRLVELRDELSRVLLALDDMAASLKSRDVD